MLCCITTSDMQVHSNIPEVPYHGEIYAAKSLREGVGSYTVYSKTSFRLLASIYAKALQLFFWDKKPSVHFSLMLISLFSKICCTRLGANILVTDGVRPFANNNSRISYQNMNFWISSSFECWAAESYAIELCIYAENSSTQGEC